VSAPDSSIRILLNRRKLREAAVDRRRVLVLAISTRDSRSTNTAEALSPYLFGKDRVSLVTQMQACSAGNLLLEPIFGGVVDIALDGTMEDYPGVLDSVQESLKVLQEKYYKSQCHGCLHDWSNLWNRQRTVTIDPSTTM
jgi:hypothetical protein